MERAQKGFSLVEMIVTLAIMGLALSVSAPPIMRLLDAADFRNDVNALARDFESLRVRAFLAGRDMMFDPEAPGAAPLPTAQALAGEGWRFAGDRLLATRLGVCLGGAVVASAPDGRMATITVAAPDCDADDGLG